MFARGRIKFERTGTFDDHAAGLAFPDRGGKHIVATDKLGDEGVGGRVKHLARVADLFDPPALHDHHQIGQGQSFHLRMGDVNEGQPGLFLQLAQFRSHAGAQKWIEGGKRLVQQQDVRIGD